MFLRIYTRVQVWHAETRARLIDQYGATAVEYALMLAFIFAVIVGAVAFMGRQTNSKFESFKLPP